MARKSIKRKFRLKALLNPQDYFDLLGKEAIELALITEPEFDGYRKQFDNMKLSPPKAVRALETIVQFREQERLERKTKLQSDDSFVDGILKAKKHK